MAWPASPRLIVPPEPTSLARERELRALRRENEALRQALEDRRLVARAKALLMVREALSEPEAFRRIQKRSMDTRTPMTEIARGILRAVEPRSPADLSPPAAPRPSGRVDRIARATISALPGRRRARTRT